MLPRLASLLVPMMLVAACGPGDGNRGEGPDARPTRTPDAEPAPDAADPQPDAADAPDAAPDAAAPEVDAGIASPDAQPDAMLSGSADAQPGCSLWSTDVDSIRPPGATLGATVHDGILELSSTGDGQGSCSVDEWPCTAVKVYTTARLVGDFDVTLEVDGVDGGTTFGGVDLFVTTGGASFAVTHEIEIAGREGAATLIARSGHQSWTAFAPTTKATLRLHRIGTTLTATATAGGEVLEKSSFSSSDLQLGIALAEGTSTAITGRIAGLTVDGGGGAVQSDAFDCTANLLP